MIDFSKIKSYKSAQNLGFEELICQIARRENPFGDNSEFRRIEGAGGDGGVEAYWQSQNGLKIGYQAKYFLKSGNIDWSQIDKSVQTALKTHPKLTGYIVALPCDLTDRGGKKKQGSSGWERWEGSRIKWAKWAAEINIHVNFEVWTASTIIDKLSHPSAIGLKSFWFNEIEFSEAWYKEHVEKAIANFGERYNPGDHVNIKAEEIGYSVVRHPYFIKEISDSKSYFGKISVPISLYEDDSNKDFNEKLNNLNNFISELKNIDFNLTCNLDFPIPHAIDAIKQLKQQISYLVGSCHDKIYCPQSSEGNKIKFENINNDLYNFKYDFESFCNLIESNKFSYDKNKFVIISGMAGVGKSHLSAFLAEQACNDMRPVFLFDGKYFKVGENPLDKICSSISKTHSHEETLSAINVAGESAGVRSLIIIDAINEGAGAGYWNHWLGSFVTALSRYPYIACIMTCRTEYEKFAVREDLYDKITRHEISGFSTTPEQEAAAKIYLDANGILRPSTIWFNPEFTNPLFLRSAVKAMIRDGKKEFPKGLNGISALFAYFVEATAKNISASFNGLPSNLSKPIFDSLKDIAGAMLDKNSEEIPRSVAEKILQDKFRNYSQPEGSTWLDLLIRNGLLQSYPNEESNNDPLSSADDLICFSFQRFQDHVMAIQICEKIENADNARAAFKEDGIAGFCAKEISKWSGLISALSIIFPEKFSIELIDCLTSEDYIQQSSIYESFVESIRWREKNAFSQRTKDLLPNIDRFVGMDSLSLVIEMSVCEDHPFNAENLLHPCLIKLAMPERDAWWSTALTKIYKADYDEEESHPLYRIIDWCLDGAQHSTDQIRNLAALVMAWSFSTSNKYVRDHATKSLVSLIEIQPDIFQYLIDKFNNIDDLYILERIYAAAYGAACRNYDAAWAASFAKIAFDHIFAHGKPPMHLLLRDYARGLVDIAKSSNRLDTGIDYKLACPPYSSPRPEFNITEDDLKKIADEAGSSEIFNSCTDYDDFGRNKIQSATYDFLQSPLDEKKQHRAQPFGTPQKRLWVAKRAYEYGWKKELFGNQQTQFTYPSDLEQIDKKYQWLALSELQCRLADNYHIRDSSQGYQGPLSIGFQRDVDPTIIRPHKINQLEHDDFIKKIMGPEIDLGECATENLHEWAFMANPADDFTSLPFRKAPDGRKFIVLYEHRSTTEKDENEIFFSYRRQEFRFVSAIIIKNNELDNFLEYFEESINEKNFNHDDFASVNFTDGPFLLEHPWCSTWDHKKWTSAFWSENAPKIYRTTESYFWESHLDKTMPKGCRIHFPSRLFCQEFELKIYDETCTKYINRDKETSVVSVNCPSGGGFVAIDVNIFEEYLKKNKYYCLWVFYSERTAFNKIKSNGSGRRISGIAWQNNGEMKCVTHTKDYPVKN